MKQKILFAFLIAFSSCIGVNAQKNVIKFNIFAPIVKTANFQYERAIGENKSV